jgi:hypothetical protein
LKKHTGHCTEEKEEAERGKEKRRYTDTEKERREKREI